MSSDAILAALSLATLRPDTAGRADRLGANRAARALASCRLWADRARAIEPDPDKTTALVSAIKSARTLDSGLDRRLALRGALRAYCRIDPVKKSLAHAAALDALIARLSERKRPRP